MKHSAHVGNTLLYRSGHDHDHQRWLQHFTVYKALLLIQFRFYFYQTVLRYWAVFAVLFTDEKTGICDKRIQSNSPMLVGMPNDRDTLHLTLQNSLVFTQEK